MSLDTCLPETRLYCLFFVYVSFREEKKDENTANAALNKTIFLVYLMLLIDVLFE